MSRVEPPPSSGARPALPPPPPPAVAYAPRQPCTDDCVRASAALADSNADVVQRTTCSRLCTAWDCSVLSVYNAQRKGTRQQRVRATSLQPRSAAMLALSRTRGCSGGTQLVDGMRASSQSSSKQRATDRQDLSTHADTVRTNTGNGVQQTTCGDNNGVVVLALALQWTSGQTTFEYFSPWFCFKKGSANHLRAWPVGVIGVSRQALAGSIRR